MPEWSIVISGPKGSVKLDPVTQEVFSKDLVFWSNRTDDPYTITIDPHTIVVDNKPTPAVPDPIHAKPWDSSKPAYQAATAVTYTCTNDKDKTTLKGSITIRTAVLLLALLAGVFGPSLKAQVKCADLFGGELVNPPELTARDTVKNQVHGTLVTTGEKQLVAFLKTPPGRVTPANRPQSGLVPAGQLQPSDVTCAEQWMRTYRNEEPPADSQRPNSAARLPQPGPTIRTRIGDLVQLTFLNLIDPLNFPGTDTGECDEVTGDQGPIYPQTDKFPNCFHGSVFTNIHFHGTHTSPNTTADNVYLEIVPSPRARDATRAPAVTAASVKADFTKFFGDCRTMLNHNDSPQLWPRIWDNLPEAYRKTQDDLLFKNQKALYDANRSALANGGFPQNYVGAFPYCFRLPVYTPAVFPPPPPPAGHHDAVAPRPLMMGQAPGTHWYHAHKHGSTTINVSNGMTGAMIVEGPYDDEIDTYYDSRGPKIKEKVIVLNQIGGAPRLEGGNQPSPGAYFSVNGRLQPTITMDPGEVQLWRIANTSSRSGAIFTARVDGRNGLQWRQVAVDGVQLSNARYTQSQDKEFVLASGNRVDLLVRMSSNPSTKTLPVNIFLSIDPLTDRSTGKEQLLLNAKPSLNQSVRMEFMDRSQTASTPPVKFPPFLTDIKESEVTGKRTIVFATDRDPNAPGFTNHTIDGKKFDGDVGALVLLNRVEEWKIVNASFAPKIAHPFHIHINPFQIIEEFEPNAVLVPATAGLGTITTTLDSPIATGTGTQFTKTFRVGDIIAIAGESQANVVAIESNEKLTLSIGKGKVKGVTGKTYTVTVPLYSTNASKDDRHPDQCPIDPAKPETWRPCIPTAPAEGLKWWDVFSIPSGNVFYTKGSTAPPTPIPGSFTMRSRFVDYPGYFVIHCHILSHEDRGMMTVVSIAPLQPPFIHH
jgi:FtsP/CotA-like multicopper oxidase with cupredoxin domain